MKVQLLFFDDCAFWQTGLEHLKVALQLEGIPPKVELVRIEDDVDAARQEFLGSPSFRVDGLELWPEERGTYGLTCRLYQTAEGLKACPSVPMLRQRIRDFLNGRRDFWPVDFQAKDPESSRSAREVNIGRPARARVGHK
jgi:hypothetical protein